jgi:peptidoglycan hydrolase-like protein with peptidoglycan-binding domain
MAELTLRRGSSGTAVRQLQQALTDPGHAPGPTDGTFGPRTEAVRSFQADRGIGVDATVGPQTWADVTALDV